MPNKNEVIDSHLQSRLDNYIAEASKLCAQPSVSARSEGTKECGQLVVEILKNHSLQVQSFQTPGNPVIVGRVKG
ncbi:peptidase M20, partial [Candidatus Acetothermia bacterium]|nr:peptidase M20 [Candidatus Acetothermia bacterium]